MSRKIILDCDPGHDDAIAMLLAHASPEIELLAVTTVGGNQTLAKVTNNAQRIATVYGMQGVPIASGCDRPLVRKPEVAPGNTENPAWMGWNCPSRSRWLINMR